MEVLVRYQCRCYHQPQEAFFNVPCPHCNGRRYLECWMPYLCLKDVQAFSKDTIVMGGGRETPEYFPSYLDEASPAQVPIERSGN